MNPNDPKQTQTNPNGCNQISMSPNKLQTPVLRTTNEPQQTSMNFNKP